VRLDEALPASAALVAIMRTDALIALAPAKHELESLSDLAGKRVGLVARSPLDEPSFLKVLDVFGLKPADLKLSVIKADEVGPLTAGDKLDAVVVIGVPADPDVSTVVYAAAGPRKDKKARKDSKKSKSSKNSKDEKDDDKEELPTILAAEIGEFLKTASAASDEVKIPKHAFARRLIPAEEIATVGVPTVLAANRSAVGPVRTKVYNNAITELTKGLIERRTALARQVSLASLIAAPDHEKGARFPLHPGAAAYLSDTDVSWFTLLSDQVWNILLVGGMLSSAFAATAGFLKRSEKDPLGDLLDRLRKIAERARSATDASAADALDQELSDLAVALATIGYERHASYEQFAPVQLAFDTTRDAIAALRRRTRVAVVSAPRAGVG
jgi:hypothetical protein